MDDSSIFARLVSGLVVRAAAAGTAIYAAGMAWGYVRHVFEGVSHVL